MNAHYLFHQIIKPLKSVYKKYIRQNYMTYEFFGKGLMGVIGCVGLNFIIGFAALLYSIMALSLIIGLYEMTLMQWVKDYQTLITGVMAVGAAWLTVSKMEKQIKLQETLFKIERRSKYSIFKYQSYESLFEIKNIFSKNLDSYISIYNFFKNLKANGPNFDILKMDDIMKISAGEELGLGIGIPNEFFKHACEAKFSNIDENLIATPINLLSNSDLNDLNLAIGFVLNKITIANQFAKKLEEKQTFRVYQIEYFIALTGATICVIDSILDFILKSKNGKVVFPKIKNLISLLALQSFDYLLIEEKIKKHSSKFSSNDNLIDLFSD